MIIKPKKADFDDFILNEECKNLKTIYDIFGNCSQSFKIFCVLHTALNFRLFDNTRVSKTLNGLCEALGTDTDFTRNICKILTDSRLLEEGDGFYKNTEISDLYLRLDSPLSLYPLVKNLMDGFELWKRLEDIVKNGPVRIAEDKFFENYIHAHASEALSGELQRVTKIISELPEFKDARKLLDLGGGHGLYAIALTKSNPNLAAYVFDFPDVVTQTRTYIKRFNADRVEIIPGNFFSDDIGAEYDVVFSSYNPGGKNPLLVPKIHSSLKEGGLFINKHVFYHRGEGTKNPLLDIEWDMVAWEGVKKKKRIYSFEGDLSFEDYIELLEQYFSIQKIIESPDFAGYPLSRLGDPLDTKIVIAKKTA